LRFCERYILRVKHSLRLRGLARDIFHGFVPKALLRSETYMCHLPAFFLPVLVYCLMSTVANLIFPIFAQPLSHEASDHTRQP
jgi:hypothetical protein